MSEIRPLVASDLPALKQVLDSIELFPSEMLDDLTHDYLNNPESEEIWFTGEDSGVAIALGYCVPEKMTQGTSNLLALGVRSDIQSKGIGRRMMNYIENLLRERHHNVLIVDTSSTQEYAATRAFYEKLGFTKEAVIRDFWSEGDDKVVYWKKLNP